VEPTAVACICRQGDPILAISLSRSRSRETIRDHLSWGQDMPYSRLVLVLDREDHRFLGKDWATLDSGSPIIGWPKRVIRKLLTRINGTRNPRALPFWVPLFPIAVAAEMSSNVPSLSQNGLSVSSEWSRPLSSPKMSALTEYNSLDPMPNHPSFAGIPKSFLLPDGYPDYLRLILTSRVYEITQETPLTSAVNLSARLGVRVAMKREDLQPVFSFKIRGAYNKMAHIPEEDRWKGVVACSAGTLFSVR